MLIKEHLHAVANTRDHAHTGQRFNRKTDRVPWSIGSSNIMPYCWLNPFCGAAKLDELKREEEEPRRKEKSQLECLFLLRGLTWRRLREPETDGVFIHTCEEIRETTKRSCIRRKLIWIPVPFSFSSFFPRAFWKTGRGVARANIQSFGKFVDFLTIDLYHPIPHVIYFIRIKENRRNNCLINCKYISYFPFCINALFFRIFAQIYLIYSVA